MVIFRFALFPGGQSSPQALVEPVRRKVRPFRTAMINMVRKNTTSFVDLPLARSGLSISIVYTPVCTSQRASGMPGSFERKASDTTPINPTTRIRQVSLPLNSPEGVYSVILTTKRRRQPQRKCRQQHQQNPHINKNNSDNNSNNDNRETTPTLYRQQQHQQQQQRANTSTSNDTNHLPQPTYCFRVDHPSNRGILVVAELNLQLRHIRDGISRPCSHSNTRWGGACDEIQ